MTGGLVLLGLGSSLLAGTYLTAHTVPLGGYSLLIWVTLAGGLFRTVGAAVAARRGAATAEGLLPPTAELIPVAAAVQGPPPATVEAPPTALEQDLWVLGLGPDVSTLKDVRRAYWELCASLGSSDDPRTANRLREAHTAYRRLRQLIPSRSRQLATSAPQAGW